VIITADGTSCTNCVRVTTTVKVDTPPKISLNPVLGPQGQLVKVSQSSGQWSSADTTCTITSPTLIITSSSCAMVSGVLQSSSQFQVGASAPGAYEIDVNGLTSLVVASATFTLTPLTPTIVTVPQDGPLGTKIAVQGTGFSSSDSSCQITSTLVNLITAQSCSVGGGKVTGSFIVGVSVAGPATITVTGNTGDFATTSAFFVDAQPILVLSSTSAPPGTTITITLLAGTRFSSGDSAACSISSTPGGLFASSACVISAGGTSVTGTFFVVGNVQAGKSFLVTVKGSLGDSASATFTVTSPVAPAIFFSPSDGPQKTKVTVSGVGFPGQDFSCILSASGTLFAGSPAPTCSISSGKITASFTVATGAAPGPYTVTVTSSSGGIPGTGSDFFTVDVSATLLFNGAPSLASGTPGTNVQVSLSGPPGQLSSGSTTCTLSSTPGGLFASSACHIAGGGTDLTGTFFLVASVPTGSSYTVVVTGNFGDTAVGTFQVIFTSSLTLVPTLGPPGTKVSFTARGLLTTDSSCTVTSDANPVGNSPVSSPTCSMSAGTGTGSFVVGPLATADGPDAGFTYTITVTGNPGTDIVTAAFNVIPSITLTPSTGTSGTTVSLSGQGFSSTATGICPTATATLPSLTATVSCVFNGGTGQASGGFTVSVGAGAGTYVITVGDGTFSAQTAFQEGTPSADVTVTPNVALPGTTVGVSGFGFNGNDASCTITPIAGVIASAPCNISGGTAGGSVTLSPTAPAGTYLITVTGNLGDFASNYLEVILLTGTFTTITTTSSTSIVSTTFTTMTTSTSQSLTFTTFTFTGIWTAVSYVLTTQTFTGESTASSISTTTTIITSVQATATTVATTTSTLGQMIRPVFASNQTAYDAVGLIAVFMLLGSMVLRRLVF